MKLRTDTFKLDIVEASYMEIRDTYDELVILDGLYFGIEKEVGNHNAKHCSYDRVYCEKFETIMGMRKEYFLMDRESQLVVRSFQFCSCQHDGL